MNNFTLIIDVTVAGFEPYMGGTQRRIYNDINSLELAKGIIDANLAVSYKSKPLPYMVAFINNEDADVFKIWDSDEGYIGNV